MPNPAHVNISAAGVAKSAQNKREAIELIEYLASPKGSKLSPPRHTSIHYEERVHQNASSSEHSNPMVYRFQIGGDTKICCPNDGCFWLAVKFVKAQMRMNRFQIECEISLRKIH